MSVFRDIRVYAALGQIFDAANACASTGLALLHVNKISTKLNKTENETKLVLTWMT
jgi:hypothetical protein